jgi:glycosyltransferase involved in cell wall biosynthesis/predicted metal-dependent phosphoesterase TrpH
VAMSSAGAKIGILTPYLWTAPSGVNRHVEALAQRFSAMGRRVTVIAPSDDRTALQDARRRVREVLLEKRPRVFDEDEPYPRYFFAGGTYPVRHNRTVKVIAAPVDLISNIDLLLEVEELDILHLHDPFVPSLGWTALRHARCPLVATFHANSEKLRQYWLTRPVLGRFFMSFDATIAVSEAARDCAARSFPGDYRVIPPGIDLERFRPAATRRPGPLRLLFVGADSRRKGLGVLMRSLKYLDGLREPLTLDVCGAESQEQRFRWLAPGAWQDRITFHGRLTPDGAADLYRDADIFCAPSLGNESFGIVLLEAMASGTAIVASDIAGYDEVVRDGREATLVPPRHARALARALQGLVESPDTRRDYVAAGLERVRRFAWDRVADEVDDVYEQVLRRVRRPSLRRGRRDVELFADLHTHSHHSKDCAMSVPELLARAREVGLDVVAITDHNSVAGGLEGRELASRYGVRVIVGEEVKTAEGEVIGLFLERTVAAGLSFAATIAEIKAQGGIVYVPHPFDRLHTVPSRTVLGANVTDIDVIEVFNSRIAFPAFNEQAERFARRYRLPAAAGSDSHVLPGLGTALTGMAEFEGRDDFVAALADSRIVRRRKSVLYLTARKFVQTNLTGQLPR